MAAAPKLQETSWRNKPVSLVSTEDMLRLGFSLILKDDMEAKLCCFQGKMPAARLWPMLHSRALPPLNPGKWMWWCITPLSVESFRFRDSVDAQHPQNNIVSSQQRDTKLGFRRISFSFILLDFVCRLSFNSTRLQNDFTFVTKSMAQFYGVFH